MTTERITEETLEELEYALYILKGDNGRIYPVSSLSNEESAGHDTVVKALCIIMNDELFDNYLCRYEWFEMDDSVRAEYGAEDYEDFCNVCDDFNQKIIDKAIEVAEEKMK